MESILITGGTGFIGSSLARRLIERGYAVRILDNLWRGGSRNPPSLEGAEFVKGDIRNSATVADAMRGVNMVFHLASIQGTRHFYEKPDLVLDVGVLGCLNVAKASKDAGISRIIYASSSEVYGRPTVFPTPESHPLTVPDPTNPRWSYGATKILGEVIFLNYAKKQGYDATILRIHNAYGPGMGWDHVIPEFCRRLVLGNEFVIEGSGEETRSFCYIDDIVEGIYLAATKGIGNQIFNLGNDTEEIRIIDLARKLSKVAGIEITPSFTAKKEGGTDRRLPDISKARGLLGYEPKVPLDEGLQKTFEWYQNEIEWWVNKSESDHYPWLTN